MHYKHTKFNQSRFIELIYSWGSLYQYLPQSCLTLMKKNLSNAFWIDSFKTLTDQYWLKEAGEMFQDTITNLFTFSQSVFILKHTKTSPCIKIVQYLADKGKLYMTRWGQEPVNSLSFSHRIVYSMVISDTIVYSKNCRRTGKHIKFRDSSFTNRTTWHCNLWSLFPNPIRAVLGSGKKIWTKNSNCKCWYCTFRHLLKVFPMNNQVDIDSTS
jgi:hypothetical protein